MKIIFLDIDGVLNGYGWFVLFIINLATKLHLREFLRKTKYDIFGVHELKVRRLAKIVKATGAKVVMSSSWRFSFWKTPFERQQDDTKKLTLLLKKYNIEVIDITKNIHGIRHLEIQDWLDNHDNIENYVILDDENFDLQPFVKINKLVQTSNVANGELIMGHNKEYPGLKRKHVKKAIKILNS